MSNLAMAQQPNGGGSVPSGHHREDEHTALLDRHDTSVRARPSPLGMFGFALTLMCQGFYLCGVGLPGANAQGDVGPYQVVFGLAVFAGGINQLITAVLCWVTGDSFGYAAHGSYGAFWLSFAMLQVPALQIQLAYNGNVRAYTVAIGIYLMAWALISLIFTIGCLRTNVILVALFVTLTLAFFFTSVASLIQDNHATESLRTLRAGGVFAILSATMAFWYGAHTLFEHTLTSVKIPVFSLQKGVVVDVEQTTPTTNGQRHKVPIWRKLAKDH